MRIRDLKGQVFGKLKVLHRAKNNKLGRSRWLCECECGNKKCVCGFNLLSGGTKSCGCSKKQAPNFKNLEGRKFGRLTTIQRDGTRDSRAKWLCQCDCGKSTVVCSKELINGDTRSCGCLQSEIVRNNTWKGCGEIPMRYWRDVMRGATIRKIAMSITIQDAWKLFLKQDKKCALTKLPLSFGSNSKRRGIEEQTASLDRINSQEGYSIDNVQWVHKQIQKMKNNIPQENFIKFCSLVNTSQLK